MSSPMTRAAAKGQLLCCWLVAAATAAAVAGDGGGGDVYRLLVLHTNDMHSQFDQMNVNGGDGCSQSCYGGFGRVKAAADRERAQAVGRTLFLNAGDSFQGTPYFTYLGWPIVARMVDRLGIDVMCLGNHEFDLGVEDLRMFVHNVSVPVVSSNLDMSGEPLLADEPNLTKSKVLTVNGRRIGIIGYLTPETALVSSVGNLKILPEIPAVDAEAKRLKAKGVDIIIALGHSGFEADVEIAKHVEDIDLVIGGHSNTFLYTGDIPDVDKPVGPYPFWVDQTKTKRRVPVVQAFHITKYLGKLWMEFDDAGEVVASYGNPILLDDHIEPDRELSDIVAGLREKVAAQTKQVVGTTNVFLEGENKYCRMRECNFGNFLTDAYVNYNVRTYRKSFDVTKSWTNAPIAIIQSGSIRVNIDSIYAGGNITTSHLLSILPFRNIIGMITTRGIDIWKAFEYSVRRYSSVQFYGEFLQVSGLKVVIDLAQPSGQRVRSIEARCGDCTVPIYKKLDLNANYTVIMSQYLANGGDGLMFEKVVGFRDFGMTEIDILLAELRNRSPIWPEIDGRIILLNADRLQRGTDDDGGRSSAGSEHGAAAFLWLAAVFATTCI